MGHKLTEQSIQGILLREIFSLIIIKILGNQLRNSNSLHKIKERGKINANPFFQISKIQLLANIIKINKFLNLKS
jgi:hypothetical protein